MDVLIVDDHPILHQTLRAAVRRVAPQAVAHVETDLAGALECARRLKRLELVLLDLGLPDCSGLDSLKRFRRAFPRARVAVVSATDDCASIRAALDAGAVGYIPKTSSPSVMVAALRFIVEGGTYTPPEALPGAPEQPPARKPRSRGALEAALTGRQNEVLHLLGEGCSNREIAERLDIAENTVKQHTHALFRVLGVATRSEAMIVALRLRGRPG